MLHRSSTLFAVLWAGLLLVAWLMVGVIEVMLHHAAPHADAWVLGLVVVTGLGLVLLPGKRSPISYWLAAGMGLLLGGGTGAALYGWPWLSAVLLLGATLVPGLAIRWRLGRLVESALEGDEDEGVHALAVAATSLATPDERQGVAYYPSRARLIPATLVQILFIIAFNAVVLLMAWGGLREARDYAMVLATALLDAVVVPSFAANLYRLAVHRPSLVLTYAGIVDHASVIAGGVGLIPWDEVLGIFLYIPGNRRRQIRSQQRWLSILVKHPRAMRARLKPLTRLLSMFIFRLPASIAIHEQLLPRSVDAMIAEIETYARAHGYLLTDKPQE
jgi:hypothetical protein